MSEGSTLTVMPSMLDSSAVSNYGISPTNHSHIQSQITSEPLFLWQDHPQSALFDQAPYGSRFDTSYSISHPQTKSEAHGDATQGRWGGAWDNEPSRGPPIPLISALSPPNSSFQSQDDLADCALAGSSTQRPTLPLPFRCNPRSRWTESPIGNTMHDMRIAPQSQSPPFLPYDVADHMGPPLYSTVSSDFYGGRQPNMKRYYQDVEDDVTVDSFETDGESTVKSEPPYAKLIYQALMAAPGYRMVLRDIYDWIGKNTDKARDPAFKGWQNSVRHNLSMNGAFEKVPYDDPTNKSKKGFIWVLKEFAVGKGIESTTRYRQKTASKKSEHSRNGDLKRQKPARKGGKAARSTGRARRPTRMEDPGSYYYSDNGSDCYRTGRDMALNSPGEPRLRASPSMNPHGGLPYWLHTPPLSARSSLPNHPCYSYGDSTSFESTSNCNPFDTTDDCSSYDEPMLHSDSGNRFDDHFLNDGLPCL